jgi:hypothetical protein
MARFGRSRKSGKAERKPDGQVRQSQLIGAYGAGAMVDLVQHAVVVSGLDDWSHAGQPVSVDEPRLKDRLEELYRLNLADEDYFCLAPVGDDDDPSPKLGIRVLEFPAWFVCQGCRRLIHRRGPSEVAEKDGWRFHDCGPSKRGGAKVPMVPVRFVGACPRGHLQDFPWVDFAHFGKDVARCRNPELYLHEGVHGDFSEIIVKCSCGAPPQRLANVHADQVKLGCGGERPWLPPGHAEACDHALSLLVRTASNGYFALVQSALSVPDPATIIRDALSRDTERIKKRADKSEEKVRELLEDDHEQLVAAHGMESCFVQAMQLAQGVPAPRERTRTGEYLQLTRHARPHRPASTSTRPSPSLPAPFPPIRASPATCAR